MSWLPLRDRAASVTPVLRSRTLDALAGAQLAFKAEHLQRGGAFKFRGACNAVWSLDADRARAWSPIRPATTALPWPWPRAPVAFPATWWCRRCGGGQAGNIARHGATLWRCPPTIADREAACAKVQADTGATLVHPYADAAVMAGQGTAALELLHSDGPFDVLVVPVGGGGLASGTARPAVRQPGDPAGAGRTGRCRRHRALAGRRRRQGAFTLTPSATACVP